VALLQPLHAVGLQAVALDVLLGPLPAAHDDALEVLEALQRNLFSNAEKAD
jgi:hypothetical protein